MPQSSSTGRRSPTAIWLVLSAVFIVLIYSNTFRASWHLDDYSTIVENDQIHMETITWQGLVGAYHGGPKGTVWRPVAFVSFALNWAFGGDQVFGFHVVNVLIHILCAILLFFTVCALFQTPVLRQSSHEKMVFTAVLATLLWAGHPIQTQAVTYIVQRMAQLAALFYLAGIYSYLEGRLAEGRKQKVAWFLLTTLSFLLALGSKENSITFPLALLLIEAVFFQPAMKGGDRKKFGAVVLAIFGITILSGSLIFLDAGPLKILERYKGLTFTPMQRLLTESRVLVFYLFQIFLPIPSQFSIDHHFVLSKAMFDPWTTLPAILLIVALIATGFVLRRKYPLTSFAILFFFLAHSIESSIVPLQLVFEHRNYLPTLFCFPPISAGIYSILMKYRLQRKGADLLAAVFLGFFLCALGISTHARNSDWRTEKSLWADAHRKAPEMSRPLHNLAWGHYEQIGQFRKALKLYMLALEKKVHRKYERAVTYSNIAGIYFDYGYFEEAQEYWGKALSILPNYAEYRFRMALALSKQHNWDRALDLVNNVLERDPNNGNYLILKGRILLFQSQPDKALAVFRRSFRRLPRNPAAAVHCGMALEALGAPENAAVLYRYALSLKPGDLETRFRLAATHIKRGAFENSEPLIDGLVRGHSVQEIRRILDGLASAPLPEPESYGRLVDSIALKIGQSAAGIAEKKFFTPGKISGRIDGIAE